MQTINIHEAKTHLSRLIDSARQGESFIIAKAGKPMVKVSALRPEDSPTPHRLGFMRDMMQVPDDFDRLGGDVVSQLFAGGSE